MSSRRPRILFVTNELYPQKKGGIGRLIYNLLIDNRDRGFPADIHILLTANDPQAGGLTDKALVNQLGGLATLSFCPPSITAFDTVGSLYAQSAPEDWGLHQAYEQSYLYYLSIRELLRRKKRPFDIIEFPDYGGWAYASIEAKRAGLAFQKTEISVRLHSTLGLITAAEPYYHSPSAMMGWQQDMERHSLRYADRVIGHLTPVIKANADHYGFDDQWVESTHLNCPPIDLTPDEKQAARSSTQAYGQASGAPRRFVFSSRLQPFKRPDLFIRASVLFLEANPDFTGEFLAVSYGWDSDYINWLRGSIPKHMRDTIRVLDSVTPEERLNLIVGAITVIPSIYESLCLFAFEAGMMGNRVILNGQCPAFGDDTPWQHKLNCLKFDGSPQDLAIQMQSAISWSPKETVTVPSTAPYWLDEAKKTNPKKEGSESLSLAIVHYGYKSADDAAAGAQQRLDTQADTPGVQRYLALQQSGEAALDTDSLPYPVISLSGRSILPSDFHDKLADLKEELILLLPEGAEVEPSFLDLARAGLKGNPSLMGIAGFTRIVDGEGVSAALKPVATGCRTAALTGDQALDVGLVLRRSVLDMVPFEDTARQDWLRVFWRQLILEDVPLAAAPEIAVTHHIDRIYWPEKRQIANTLLAAHGELPAGIAPLGLKMDISQKQTVEDLRKKEKYLTFYGGHRVAPSEQSGGFEPVQYRKDNDDLLVHGLNNQTVIARLPIETGGIGIREIHVQMMHKGKDQGGIDVSLWAGPEAYRVLASGKPNLPHCTEWVRMAPKERRELQLSLPWTLYDVFAYVAVQLPEGTDQARAWSVVTGLKVITQ